MKKMGRPVKTEKIISDLILEIQVAAGKAKETTDPAELMKQLLLIQNAGVFLQKMRPGLRSPQRYIDESLLEFLRREVGMN